MTSEVSKIAPFRGCGSMFIVDNLDRRISIRNVGTSVSLLVAYGITYQESERKWKPFFYSGVLCYDNEFNIDGQFYNFCLIHALPSADRKAAVEICFSNTESELASHLGKYINLAHGENEGWKLHKTAIGKTVVPLSMLANLSHVINEKIFCMRGLRDAIKTQQPMLVKDGTTSSLHVAVEISKAMGFDSYTFNDQLLRILNLCYQYGLDLHETKYTNADSTALALDMIDLYRYNHNVSDGTRMEIGKAVARLVKDKPKVKQHPAVKEALCEIALQHMQ